jgi:hypothetical protein
MQIKALRTFRVGTGNIRRGATVELSDVRAKELLKAGLAEEVKGRASSDDEKKAPEPKGKGKQD